jgi:NADH-quinone oxidoreductase subunit L
METLVRIFPSTDFTPIGIALGLQLLGFLLVALFGKRLGRDAVRLLTLSVHGAVVVLAGVTLLVLQGTGAARLYWTGWRWCSLSHWGETGGVAEGAVPAMFGIDVALRADALSAPLFAFVSCVGFVIYVFATRYLEKRASGLRMLSVMNLASLCLSLLLLADNLPLAFAGIVGQSTAFALGIALANSDEESATAARKAFVIGRVGDLGLFAAMALLLKYTGGLSWNTIELGRDGLQQLEMFWQVPPGVRGAMTTVFPGGVADILCGPHYASSATLVALAEHEGDELRRAAAFSPHA